MLSVDEEEYVSVSRAATLLAVSKAEAARGAQASAEPWPELDELVEAISGLWSGPGAVEEIPLQRDRLD